MALAARTAARYRRGMTSFTSLDPLLAELARTPDLVERAATGLTAAELLFRPAPDAFSLVEHACHLRDLEVEGYGVRLRRLRDEDDPDLEGFDGTRVAAERDYRTQHFADALAAFRAARRENLRLATALTPDELARAGRFMGETVVAVPDILAMMREHDGEHVAELDALLEALKRARCPH